jgi:hypothetical protein
MGGLPRRYWQPVCTSDELRDLPREEKAPTGAWNRILSAKAAALPYRADL